MTVYVKKNRRAYNLRMRAEVTIRGLAVLSSIMLLGVVAPAQQKPATEVATKTLPAAGLWSFYSVQMSGEIADGMRWRMVGGSLPRNVELREFGRLEGVVNQQGRFAFSAVGTRSDGTKTKPKRFALEVETPLKADWLRKSQVNANRIEGSIKVSNTTGRDFDLTFDVLAVNEIGRATAIGYQHFKLKKNTRNMELPFGDTLAPGSYVLNIDVVGEEPQSNMIFRARMVAPKQTIAPVL